VKKVMKIITKMKMTIKMTRFTKMKKIKVNRLVKKVMKIITKMKMTIKMKMKKIKVMLRKKKRRVHKTNTLNGKILANYNAQTSANMTPKICNASHVMIVVNLKHLIMKIFVKMCATIAKKTKKMAMKIVSIVINVKNVMMNLLLLLLLKRKILAKMYASTHLYASILQELKCAS
jgi:hypothetical protein